MSDISKVLIAQLKMACELSDIVTCDCGQVCKPCGQDTELHELYKLGKPAGKIITIDGLSFFHIKYPATEPTKEVITHVGLVNALVRLLK